jgi:hypothetical protein
MKKTILFGLLILVCAACVSHPSDRLVEIWNQITADGIITKEEVQMFADELAKRNNATDWPTLIGGIAGSVITSFLGINFYRNKREVRKFQEMGLTPIPTTSTSDSGL